MFYNLTILSNINIFLILASEVSFSREIVGLQVTVCVRIVRDFETLNIQFSTERNLQFFQ